MNILYTLNSGKPGGMEQHVLDLVGGMVKRGHAVYVWCPSGDVVTWYKAAGAKVTEIEITKDLDFAYIKELKKFLISQNIDVIHSHELKASANSLIASYLAKTKVRISHVHTPLSEWKHPTFVKKMLGKIQTFLYAVQVNVFAHREIVLTESRKRVKRREGILPNKLQVIPNGLDLGRFDATEEQVTEFRKEIRSRHGIPEDVFVFGLVSRTTAEKGHRYLVSAFKTLLDQYIPVGSFPENFHLLLAGGGLLEDELRAQIVELGLQDKVTLTGIFESEDLPKYYRAIDGFVFPSLAEGFGFVLIEAMYTATPTICSNLEVLQEVAGDSVNFFEVANPDDIAQKMVVLYQKVLANEYDTGKMVERVINRYSMTKFISEYQNLYATLARKNS